MCPTSAMGGTGYRSSSGPTGTYKRRDGDDDIVKIAYAWYKFAGYNFDTRPAKSMTISHLTTYPCPDQEPKPPRSDAY